MSYPDNRERVARSVESAKQEASEAVRSVADKAGREATDLKRAVSEAAGQVNERLKEVGVDTDVLVNSAKEQASELQRMIGDELRARPMRALGIAAAVGFIFGIMSTR
jgi:ElaB/YqjD/DUF883 family membrane-anchored ribosome-binding protein